MLLIPTLVLTLTSLVASSPLLPARWDVIAPDPRAIFKPETLALVDTLTQGIRLPGGIVAYTSPKGDGVLTFGNRSDTGEPVTPDTHFALASNSKLFLGTVLVILSEQNITLDNGEVCTLDTPLKDFVPGFKMVDKVATEQATTLDFLSHRTGLPPHNFAITDDGTPEKDMAKLAYLRPNTPFRANFTYSNLNYAAITYVVELLTHKTYSQVLDEVIFSPLGMNAYSNFTKLVEEGEEYSQGWLREGVNYTQCGIDATIAVGKNDTSLEGLFPASCAGDLDPIDFWTKTAGQEFGGGGNIIATGNDLVKWTREILDPVHISPSVFKRLETVTFPSPSPSDPAYAIGTVQGIYRGYNVSIHDGALPGSNSYFLRIRNESIGVFAIGTDDLYSSIWYETVTNAIIADLLDLAPYTPETPPADESSGPTPPPADHRLAPDEASYIGKTYFSAGYNNFTLSILNLTDPAATSKAQIPLKFLLNDAPTLTGFQYGPTVLYAHWGQTVGEHLFFTHFDGPIWNVTVLESWPLVGRGSGSEEWVGKYWAIPSAVMTDGGIGFFDGFWGQQGTEGNRPAVEVGVEEAAEAFFIKQGKECRRRK